MWRRDEPMQWRLNALTSLARCIVMALLIFVGANIVRNVTAALAGVTRVCEKGVTHLL
jgi:hypothetical protein